MNANKETSVGKFEYKKSVILTEFVCQHCNKPKKSKNLIIWTVNNQEKTICNGCYGFLLSK